MVDLLEDRISFALRQVTQKVHELGWPPLWCTVLVECSDAEDALNKVVQINILLGKEKKYVLPFIPILLTVFVGHAQILKELLDISIY